MATKSSVSFIQTSVLANPAPGAEFTLKAPGQGLWRIISIAFTLATSVAVANRRPALTADDGTDVYFAAVSTVDLAASLTTRLCAFHGAAAAGVAGTVVNFPLPYGGLLLQPGHRLRSSTAAIDVADQYSAIRALVHEYPYGPDFEWLPTVPVQLAPEE